jgi:steroid 5-alpha-reductase/3-oxo-5-alpha-steroid 4-dehydrogenase 1
MTEAAAHAWVTWAEIILAGAALAATAFVNAPYGRYGRRGWGPTIPNAAAWLVMELPAIFGFAAVYLLGRDRFAAAPLALAALWMFHYLHRTFIFPFRVHTPGKRMPLVVAAMAFVFNCLNAYVVARWISHLGDYPAAWLRDPRFVAGALVFFTGFAVNYRADAMLIALRRPGETGYRVPRGWLFERVSCPNYFGEILEWFGYALASWSLAGLAFALFTAANIGPRAFAHHRWYHRTFPGYPPQRKALIPFVW